MEDLSVNQLTNSVEARQVLVYVHIYICTKEQRLVCWGVTVLVIVRRKVSCEHVSNCECSRDGAVQIHKCKSTVTGKKEAILLTVIVCCVLQSHRTDCSHLQ
jgi:hypothetical protein